MWLRVLALTAAYYGAGQLGLLLAIPPGFATAVWPASGIALGGLMLFGYRAWPGIVAASFLLNVPTTFINESPAAIIVSLALPLGIGAGAALQALAGAVLVSRYVGFPNSLKREQDVALFLLLAGPVSCLINATVGVFLLWCLHRIQTRECPYSWWTWWVGDTIGAFLVAPLLLLWATRTQPDWPRRPITVSVPLGVLIALVVALFVYTEAREQERMQIEFEFQVKTLTQAMKNQMEYALVALKTARGNYGNSPNRPEARKYAKAAQNILSRRAPVHALSWTPRVRGIERSAFEKAGRHEIGPDYAIREMNAARQFVPAHDRADYFPILYRAPAPENLKVLGFDVAGDPVRREALERAADTAEPVASAPIEQDQKIESEKNILVFLAIYRDGAPPESIAGRREALVGAVVAVVRTSGLVDLAWEGFRSEGIDFWLYDETASPQKQLAYFRGGQYGMTEAATEAADAKAVPGFLQQSIAVEAAGRRWTLHFAQTPQYLAANRSLQAWTVLSGGMLFTGLLGGVLLVVTGREALIAGLVQERTAELGQANAAMIQEIDERKRIEQNLRSREESLRQSEARLEESRRLAQRIAEMVPSILYVYDLKAERNIFVNRRMQSILGYSADETDLPIMAIIEQNIHPDDWPRVELANEQFLAGEEGAVVEVEFRMKHANGEWRWLHGRATVFVRDNAGDPSQILGTVQDITQRKRLEQEVLDIAAQEQRRIGQELHDGTGQELTGLCMLVDNLADMLRDSRPDEAQRARRVAQGLQHALGAVRTLSRGLIPVEVDAEGLMAALTELTKRISDLHEVVCAFDCIEPVPVEDNFVATQLYRIAQEAITNALKHSRAQNIRVALESRGRYITVRIADDGVGFAHANGTADGMGLRIMKYRAGQIGAQLVVRSGPSGGTVVTCTYYQGLSHD